MITARGGSGIVVARLPDGRWSAPSAIGIAGLGGGFEIGVEVSDLVIILNHRRAIEAFGKGGNLTLGGNCTVAVGPLGRNVEADVALRSTAAVYTYCKFYAQDIRAFNILNGDVEPPPAASNLYEILEVYTEKYTTDWQRKNLRAASSKVNNPPERPLSRPQPQRSSVNQRPQVLETKQFLFLLFKKNNICVLDVLDQKPNLYPGISDYRSDMGRLELEELIKKRHAKKKSFDYKAVISIFSSLECSPENVESLLSGRIQWHKGEGNPSSGDWEENRSPGYRVSPHRHASMFEYRHTKQCITTAELPVDAAKSLKLESQHETKGPMQASETQKPLKCDITWLYTFSGRPSEGPLVVTAMHSFVGQQPGDLSFNVGDKITVLTKSDSQYDWWEGQLRGEVGIFPANFVSYS
ncbi:SH3Y1 protein, partial [Atractosteus spatula]|nr:SH3Y1 protein [Atractosteus spatula]